jgi:hypothetical protein
MRKEQANHLTMQDGVIKHFTTQTTVWSAKKPLTKVFNLFKSVNATIHSTSEAQQNNTTMGHTNQKNIAFESILERTHELSLNLADYAIDKNDMVLYNAVNYSESALAEGTEAEIENRCSLIAEKAKLKMTELLADGYDVVDAEVDALIVDINNAKELINERNVVGSTRVTNTATLPDLFKEARKLLKQLDGLVKSSRLNNEEFVNVYFNLRNIRGTGGKSNNDVPPTK